MSFYCAALFVSFVLIATAQTDPLAESVQALQRGDLASAEETLRADLRKHPDNAELLGVLAVVLDQRLNYSEASGLYQRALALSPRAPALLNNYGNHLMATAKLTEAHAVFLKVLAINPMQANATLQLARLAVVRKVPAEALRYLDRLPPEARENPESALTLMQALYQSHRDAEADAIFAQLSGSSKNNALLSDSLGQALSLVGQYGKAEDLFSSALQAAPNSFDALYKLGLAAAHASHNERARDILDSALRKQPENVAVLYDLAAVNSALRKPEIAVQLLTQAARLAPGRADVQQLLARTMADLGYFGDALQAWDDYLRIVPGDELARRERAFALTAYGDDMEKGLAGLRAYVAKHPRDAVGRYELGIAEATAAPGEALVQLNRALAIQPDLTAAYVARGLLYLKQGKFESALPDLQIAAQRQPENSAVLDRLGQTLLALERPGDAILILRHASELAPTASKTWMHFGRALIKAGHDEEAKAVFARLRELGPDRSSLPHPRGLVDFLSLSPQEQLAKYRAGVERTVQQNPRNAEALVRQLKLQLDQNKTVEAAAIAQSIVELNPSSSLLGEAGNAMLASGQYQLAKILLEKAVFNGSSASLILSMALATSGAANPQAALEQLNRIPQPERSGDYYLVRAEILDAAGRAEDAESALRQALGASPTRADLYRYAASFLIGKHRIKEASDLLQGAVHAHPDNAEVHLMRAITLAASGRTEEAERIFKDIENRWPDWYKVWQAHGVLLNWLGRKDEARPMLEIATGLGAPADSQSGSLTASDPAERGAQLMQIVFPH